MDKKAKKFFQMIEKEILKVDWSLPANRSNEISIALEYIEKALNILREGDINRLNH